MADGAGHRRPRPCSGCRTSPPASAWTTTRTAMDQGNPDHPVQLPGRHEPAVADDLELQRRQRAVPERRTAACACRWTASTPATTAVSCRTLVTASSTNGSSRSCRTNRARPAPSTAGEVPAVAGRSIAAFRQVDRRIPVAAVGRDPGRIPRDGQAHPEFRHTPAASSPTGRLPSSMNVLAGARSGRPPRGGRPMGPLRLPAWFFCDNTASTVRTAAKEAGAADSSAARQDRHIAAGHLHDQTRFGRLRRCETPD